MPIWPIFMTTHHFSAYSHIGLFEVISFFHACIVASCINPYEIIMTQHDNAIYVNCNAIYDDVITDPTLMLGTGI